LALILLTITAVFVDLLISVEDIKASEFFKAMMGNAERYNVEYILFHVRLPRVVTALLVGSGLSIAGLMLQTLFHNPLAGPFVLGISSGAGLGVATYTMASVIFIGMHPIFTAGGQAISAMIGAGLIFILVLVFSWRLNDTVSLLIVGIMIGSLASALVGILQYFASPDMVHKFVIWSLGSLGATSWIHINIILPVFLISVILAIYIIKPLDLMLMGEIHARVSGVHVNKIRLLMIITSSLLAGTLTAFTGPVAFIGMTVPHLTRLLFKTTSHKYILPGAIVSGSLLMLICDIISQLPGRATVLPINSVTALFGAPVVVFLIVRSRKSKSPL
jgi:iron complex transport system permease protein